MKTFAQRFWVKVQKSRGCWIWIGAKGGSRAGYGVIGRGRRGQGLVYAHRASWELHKGQIPDGLEVLHKCDNPACVKPKHLFLGTQTDNMRDCAAKGRVVYKVQRRPGELNPMAKLTTEQVLLIRARQRQEYRDIADEFRVSPALISMIRLRRIWAHLPSP